MKIVKWLASIWIIAAFALFVKTTVAVINITSLSEQERIVTHTVEVHSAINEIMASMTEAETNVRGYIINKDKVYLIPYRELLDSLPRKKNAMHDLIRDNPDQTKRFEAIEPLIEERFKITDAAIKLVDQGGDVTKHADFKKSPGKIVMDQIRHEINEMVKAEETLLKERTAMARRQYWTTIFAIIIGFMISLTILVMAFLIVHKELQRRFAAEATAKKVNENLELTVQNRTIALQRTSDELLRSNSELEKFAYIASHDLQEPLRKIQAFGDRLKQKSGAALDETCRDYVDRMQSSATRMRTLINDLLAFSRVTSKREAFSRINLGDIVRDVISSLDPRIEETGAKIDIGPMPELYADPTQMRQLFQNLIANALKFRKPDGQTVVTLRATPSTELTAIAMPPPLTTGWRIVVKDNGIGFDPTFSSRIFELFQRLHGRGEYEGTGIGLSICRKIAERHGGRITAYGQPGVGAEFHVDLPDLSQPEGAA